MKLTSTGGSSKRSCLKISRRYRLIRLRVTAHPIFLVTVMPIRAARPSFSRHTTRNPFTEVLHGELESLRYSARFRKRTDFGNVTFPVSTGTIRRLLGCDSYRKVFTTFCSSSLDNQTAVFSSHSYQKSVSTLTTGVAWLKCSFHLCLPLLVLFFRKWVIKHNMPLVSRFLLKYPRDRKN